MYEYELKHQIPDPEIFLALEPDELAGVLLPILRKEAATYQGKISGYNSCNRLQPHEFSLACAWRMLTKDQTQIRPLSCTKLL
jgi:hypothetical protein